MTNLSDTELFNELHIDVARNATDDFNLFHDSKKWQYIKKTALSILVFNWNPCGFIFCALLEKAQIEQHDFEQNPMVYLSHKISIDRAFLNQLKSNDALHSLVKQLSVESENTGRQGAHIEALYAYECYGLVKDNAILFRALISLAPLHKILKSLKL